MKTLHNNRLKLLGPACLALLLAGCAMFPGSGPSRGAMWEASLPAADGEASLALVEINDPVLNILSRRASTLLREHFGDYAPGASQVIGVGDSVQITVWEAASGGLFSAPIAAGVSPGSRSASIPEQLVGRDGSVTVPYAGRIHVAGRTPAQVERAIIEKLMGKAIEPQALVNISRNVTNTVTVEGDVTNGARVPLSLKGDRILDVIASAGGYRSPAFETFVNLTRGNRTARAPLQALLDNPRENIYVRPGDIINLERAPQTFTIAGATDSNRVQAFGAKSLTLDQAIGMAGGLTDNRADPAGVYVMRFEPTSVASELPNVDRNLLSQSAVPVAYQLNMRDPKAFFAARRFAMRDKDILYVSNSPLAEMGKLMQLVNMASQPAIQGMAVSRLVK